MAEVGGASGEVESWHPAEKAAYEVLPVERQRKAFEIIRGWASRAAVMGEATFRIAQDHLARELHCSQRNISDIIGKFKKFGYIKQTKRGRYADGIASEYRWAMASTIPFVAYTGPDLEEDDPF
jgi:hypothetical protein